MAENASGHTTRVLYWIVGVQSMTLLALLTYGLSTFSSISTQSQALAISNSAMQQTLTYQSSDIRHLSHEQRLLTDKLILLSERVLIADGRIAALVVQVEKFTNPKEIQ